MSKASNDTKLRGILTDVLLIEDHDYRDSYGPSEIETWDSLAMVEISVGIEREFGCSLEPEEMVTLESIGRIKEILRARGHEFES